MQDWVLYFNEENYDFSDEFKNALSVQLKKQLETQLECPALLEKYFFNLFIGMIDPELQTRDEYTFASVELISPDSCSRKITIAWHKDPEGNVAFFFCDDFPLPDLKAYIKPKDTGKASFETYLNYMSFPDLSVKFEVTGNLDDYERKEILAIFKSDTISISGFIENSLILDFQSNAYSNLEIEKYLYECMEKLNRLKFKSKIKSVRIE